MGFRFFRRMKIAPGVTLNFSKSGPSVSLGPRGAKVTLAGKQGPRATVGVPGTGVYYTTTLGRRAKTARRRRPAGAPPDEPGPLPPPPPAPRPEERLTMGFFKRLVTPADEERFVDGLRELVSGNVGEAYVHLQHATHLADGSLLAGIVALRLDDVTSAASYLKLASIDPGSLGHYFRKYGVLPDLRVPITPEISAAVRPTLRDVLMVLVEAYQEMGQIDEAMSCLTRLLELDPGDLLMKLSLCEVLYETSRGDAAACQEILKQTENVGSYSDVHAALQLYRARALRSLDLNEAALDLLNEAARSSRSRSREIRLALQYERATLLEQAGREREARLQFEKILAAEPDYEDVAQRLEAGPKQRLEMNVPRSAGKGERKPASGAQP